MPQNEENRNERAGPGADGGRPWAALALLGIAVSIVARALCHLDLGAGAGTPGPERSILSFFDGHLPAIHIIRLASASVAAAGLAGFLVAGTPGERGLGPRGWAWISLAAVLAGGFLAGIPIAMEGLEVLGFILLVVSGYQFSVCLHETGRGETGSVPVRDPGTARSAAPSLRWMLDRALLAGAVLGGLEIALRLSGEAGALGIPAWMAAAGIVLSTQIIFAGLLAGCLWATAAALVSVERRCGPRWRPANLHLALGGIVALAGTAVIHACLYHAFYGETALNIGYVPSPEDGCRWSFIIGCIGGAEVFRRWASRPSRFPAGWFGRTLAPLLLLATPFRRPGGSGRAREAAALFLVPCILLGGSCFFLYLRESSIFPEKRFLAAQGVAASVLLISVIAGVLAARDRPEGAGGAMRAIRWIAWPLAVAFAVGIVPVDAGARSVALAGCRIHEGVTKTLRGLADLDRDGYASILGGNDPDDLDAGKNPLTREYLTARSGAAGLAAVLPGDRGSLPGRVALARSLDREEASAEIRSGVLRSSRLPDGVTNLLVVTFDGMRARSLGSYGYPRPSSPNLDAFAADSVRFEHCRSVASGTHCAFRAMYRGRYCSRRYKKEIPEPTLWTRFAEAGTFDRTIGVDYPHISSPAGNYAPGRIGFPWGKAREVFPAFLGALDRIEPGESWIGWVHSLDTHFYFLPQEDGVDFGPGLEALYDNNVSSADNAFGRLLEELRRRGLYERTVIIVSADHGTALGEHGRYYHGPILGEEVLQVPLMIRIPGAGPRVVPEAVSLLDLAPTIADLFGLDPSPFPDEGISLAPALEGRPLPAGRRLHSLSGYGDLWSVVDAEGWKLIHDRADNTWELYDLRADPGEMRNLCGRGFPRERELREDLFSFILRGFDRYDDPHPSRARRGAPLD